MRHVIKTVALAAPRTFHEAQRGAAPWPHCIASIAINILGSGPTEEKCCSCSFPTALLLPLSPTARNVKNKEEKTQQTRFLPALFKIVGGQGIQKPKPYCPT